MTIPRRPRKPKGIGGRDPYKPKGRPIGYSPVYDPEKTYRYQSKAVRYSKAVEMANAGPEFVQIEDGIILSTDDIQSLRDDLARKANAPLQRYYFRYASDRAPKNYWTVAFEPGSSLEPLLIVWGEPELIIPTGNIEYEFGPGSLEALVSAVSPVEDNSTIISVVGVFTLETEARVYTKITGGTALPPTYFSPGETYDAATVQLGDNIFSVGSNPIFAQRGWQAGLIPNSFFIYKTDGVPTSGSSPTQAAPTQITSTVVLPPSSQTSNGVYVVVLSIAVEGYTDPSSLHRATYKIEFLVDAGNSSTEEAWVCNCPDFSRSQGFLPQSKYLSEAVERDWNASLAGCDKTYGCKHIIATKLFLDLPVEAPNDYPLLPD